SVNGTVEFKGPQRILKVWGTNYEMGYAHGYLLGDMIKSHLETLAGGSSYQSDLAWANQYCVIYPEYLEEINGLIAGVMASGHGYIAALGRNVTAGDIKLMQEEVEMHDFGCSSFGVWGNTADTKSIIGRNYDYDVNWSVRQMMMVREPAVGPKTVSWGWPGCIGIQAGINQDRIVLTGNEGGGSQYGNGAFYPAIVVMRYMLEKTTPVNFMTEPLAIVNGVTGVRAINYEVGSPDTVYYIEDAPVNVIRLADNPYHIVATNHQFTSNLGPPWDESVRRYNSIYNGLNNLYSTGNHLVDSTEAMGLLRGVESTDPAFTTISSFIIRPAQLSFDVSISNGVTPAPDIAPLTYTWDELFGEMPPVAVVDSYITLRDTGLNIAAPGVLVNDTDANG
ncbi:MAG: hypothetical protein A2Z29_06325, partial [Chloroflexi bacterium RBG_16_56_11]